MFKKSFIRFSLLLILPFLAWTASPQSAAAGETGTLISEQTIYVPAYSHIYIGSNEQPFLLTVTLSIRNIDPLNSIAINVVDYYETQGQFLKHFLTTPVVLKPLESLRYVIPEKDKSGGSGANFIVKWQAGKPVNAPIIESIMIGAKTQQGISFTSRGQPILPSDQ